MNSAPDVAIGGFFVGVDAHIGPQTGQSPAPAMHVIPSGAKRNRGIFRPDGDTDTRITCSCVCTICQLRKGSPVQGESFFSPSAHLLSVHSLSMDGILIKKGADLCPLPN